MGPNPSLPKEVSWPFDQLAPIRQKKSAIRRTRLNHDVPTVRRPASSSSFYSSSASPTQPASHRTSARSTTRFVAPPPIAAQRRSKRLSALLAAILLCGGSAAFAVASWAPVSERSTLREVVESVRPLGLADVVMSMDQPGFRLFRTETVRASDTVDALLDRLSVNDPTAADFLRTDTTSRHAMFGQPWRLVSTEAGQSRQLLRLTVRWIESDQERLFHRLVVERRGDQWVSAIETAPLAPTMRLASAEIHTSLLDATDEARLPESIATQIVDVFDDIDFQSDMRRGDRFRVVYESLEGDGESLGAGRVLSVDFNTRGQTRQAIWFQPPGHRCADRQIVQCRLLHAKRPVPAARLPRVAGRVLACVERLSDAHASDLESLAAAPRR